MVKSGISATIMRLFAFGLIWLLRVPANNIWLIAVRGDVARRLSLTIMADFAQVLAPVFTSLAVVKLQTLNAEITIEGKPARNVAKRCLDGRSMKGTSDCLKSASPLLSSDAIALAKGGSPLNNHGMFSRCDAAFTRRPPQAWKADAAEQSHG